MIRLCVFVSFIFLFSCQSGEDILSSLVSDDEMLNSIAKNPDHEVQIIYTQVDRGADQQPVFTTYTFGLDSERYFYPASTVKFAAALASLEKINSLGIDGFTKDSKMVIDSSYSGQYVVDVDSTAPGYEPSIAHYIKKILLVSDNEAYNRLYEFMGQDDLNQLLRDKGYARTRIIHRLEISLSPEENLQTNTISFYDGDELVYAQPAVRIGGKFHVDSDIPKGKAHVRNGELINEPMNFRYKNYFPLDEQQLMLRSVIFPESFPNSAFRLTTEDYELIYTYMATYPAESGIEAYKNYPDSYCKFLVFGAEEEAIPRGIRMFNKVGDAYGYLLDNAYFVDFENGVEFFLTAVVHANANQTFNDGTYEYDEIGLPFLKRLGEKVYEYELNRKRKVQPDLSNFKELFN